MVLSNTSENFEWINGRLLLPGQELYLDDPPGQAIPQDEAPDQVPADLPPDDPPQDKKRK